MPHDGLQAAALRSPSLLTAAAAAPPAPCPPLQVLPPGAAQVQPLVECFFVLADVRHKLRPAEELDAAERSRADSGRCAGAWQL